MQTHNIPVPHLTTAIGGPLFPLEVDILSRVAIIESWFRQQWQLTPPSLTTSVDLRHAGFKLAPVDTNLYPAGFNNLNPDFMSLCIQAMQATLVDYVPGCRRILLLPESHTRNKFYLQSLKVLREILLQAGFLVRIGSLDPEISQPTPLWLESGESLMVEPIQRVNDRLLLGDFDPCVLVLNNDLSTGVPELLIGLKQKIMPSASLGWSMRLKSDHFSHYNQVAQEFAQLIDIDPWCINPYFSAVSEVDFMALAGLDMLATTVDRMLIAIKDKYQQYGIAETPYVAVKADNGTYGMSVMMVHDAAEILKLNRKQRTRMAASKGGQVVTRVIIQEGVFTFETMPDGAVAEPVVYMIGPFVVGGFYRVHKEKGITHNLNAPGMHFEPLAFAQPCNMPRYEFNPTDCHNRFYSYGVIARLAALAAAREIAQIGAST